MIVCTGRELDDENRPTGEPCGASERREVDVLRASGWKIGPAGPGGDRPAMCPKCARDPALARLCAALARSATTRPETDLTEMMDTLPGL